MHTLLFKLKTGLALALSVSASLFAAEPEPIINTATLFYTLGSTETSLASNTTEIIRQRAPTPATVKFLRLAPNSNGAQIIAIDGGQCSTAQSGMRALSAPQNINNIIVNPQAAPVLEAKVFHANEPVVIALNDQNRNRDPQIRETVEVNLTSSVGDTERLTLKETTPDSGIFTAIIETAIMPPAPVARDCKISVAQGATLTASYADTFFPTDIAQANILVDPFGVLFDSANGTPINGARITIVDDATGIAAQVFGDDGISAYPSSLITGGSVTDASGRQYDFPIGGYRFPFLAPGRYRFIIDPPIDYVVPSNVDRNALAQLRDTTGLAFVITTGSFLDTFELSGPEAVKIDIPADPLPGQLALQKTASVGEASVGDFVQYRLTLENRSSSATARNIDIIDTLPAGFRYRLGTARLGNLLANDPKISADGQTLTFNIGTIAPSSTVRLSYITQVIRDFEKVEAINRAIASVGNINSSNEARASVRIRRAIITDRVTIVGQVTEGACSIARGGRPGVGNIRIFLDDGTYVTTDSDGRYHFEGVRAGTHVVQIDTASLPEDMELVQCGNNTRWAGRSFSQFIEARGGALWRADFYVRKKTPLLPRLTLNVQRQLHTGTETKYTFTIEHDAKTPLKQARMFLSLPKSIALVQNSLQGANLISKSEDIAMGIISLGLDALVPSVKHSVSLNLEALNKLCKNGKIQAFIMVDTEVRKALRSSTLNINANCQENDTPLSVEILTASIDLPKNILSAAAKNETLTELDDATAAGANVDWFSNATVGSGFLFPTDTHNPRAPVVRAVVKHAPSQTVDLLINGKPVDPISYDGTNEQLGSGISVSEWRGIPLNDGPNIMVAIIKTKDGVEVTRHNQTVHFANAPAHAVLVPEKSNLVADGISPSVIAVRITDRFDRPVRAGVSGPLDINSPFVLAQSVNEKQLRQFSGNDSNSKIYRIEGDDGIARIALQPSSDNGSVVLGFNFGNDRTRVREEVRAWLTPKTRDWIIIGFAKGSLGHKKLTGNSENLPEPKNGFITDGSTSLYAKGRIKGDWLLTLAYDSDKPRGRTAQDRELLRVIDPNKYYTLYGDQTQQSYDAASLERVYVRLERKQFYALFGDYETGLNQTEFGRYNRSFNGLKSEYRNDRSHAVAFASKNQFNFARDELQGNGLATFYRLNRNQIIINSDKISIETRDRLRSEKIIDTRTLTRHIDYDIDYAAGTLTFREPIRSRDSNFNPVFIIANYETFGAAGNYVSAGGRVEQKFLSQKLEVGATGLYDESTQGTSKLGGIDFKAHLTRNTLIRAEAARSTTKQNGTTISSTGNAYLAEIEHRSQTVDALIYFREQDNQFGVGQQNSGESGTRKYGADGRVRITDAWQLSGSAYREDYTGNNATRTATQSRIEHVTAVGTYFAGIQFTADEIASQPSLKSTLLSAGFNRFFFDRKLEIQAQSDISISGSAESADFPNRYRLGAAYRIRENVRIIGSYEITNGRTFDSRTAQIGIDVQPWHGSKITSTLNQARISEFGPRTYGQFGINQAFVINPNLSVNLGGESNHSFNQRLPLATALNPNQPFASGGALADRRAGASAIEDFWAVSAGATYRHEVWSATARAEHRSGEISKRTSLSTAVIRQTKSGIAMSGFGQLLDSHSALGGSATRATLGAAFAYRPLGSDWSVLNKIEYRSDSVTLPATRLNLSSVFNNEIANVGSAKSRRIVNNIAINYFGEGATSANDVWDDRAQISLTYASKYVMDRYDGLDISGYSDFIGLEVRKDFGSRIDLGFQGGMLTNWATGSRSFTFGPQIGISPFDNAWISFGYNIDGFRDRDFEAARATSQGPYVTFRLKFDQLTAHSIFGR